MYRLGILRKVIEEDSNQIHNEVDDLAHSLQTDDQAREEMLKEVGCIEVQEDMMDAFWGRRMNEQRLFC